MLMTTTTLFASSSMYYHILNVTRFLYLDTTEDIDILAEGFFILHPLTRLTLITL